MDTPTTTSATRHDGWTDARKALFLDELAHHGNVLRACAAAGMSREAAYRLRRREHAVAMVDRLLAPARGTLSTLSTLHGTGCQAAAHGALIAA